jgi:outer membrane protein assembly factor BamA
MSYDPNHDVSLLVAGMQRFAEKQADGTYKTTFGKIFRDEILEQQLESLVRTGNTWSSSCNILQFLKFCLRAHL